MTITMDPSSIAYDEAWTQVALILLYYITLTIAFHWRPRRKSGVTVYEPPHGVSPTLVAYLFEGGRCERAFAAALVALASKGYLGIEQKKDRFELEKLRDPDKLLPKEEVAAMTQFFASEETYGFNASDCDGLYYAYREFTKALEGIAEPDLMSGHFGFWMFGIAYSAVPILTVLVSVRFLREGIEPAWIAYIALWMVFGVSCLVAAIRVWPGTIRKVTSFLPGISRPIRPLNMNDGVPFFLTATALMSFLFLASVTSGRFAELLAAVVILDMAFRYPLETPTRAGRKILDEIEGFREFLSRADADRLNRENEPGRTPEILEKYSAYAIALNIEHAWGEEFSENLLELLQFNQAYRLQPRTPLSIDDGSPIELKIRFRK